MAGNDEPEVKPDVPPSTGIVKDQAGAQRIARRTAGIDERRCRFHCPQCGWSETIEFTNEELEAMGGDARNYAMTGQCPKCEMPTLVPYESFFGDEFTSLLQRAKEARREEYREQAEVHAEVLVDKMKDAVGDVLAGSVLDKTPAERTHDDAQRSRDDLPAEADLSDLPAREAK